LRIFRRFSPALVFSALLASLLAACRSRAALQLEILTLRNGRTGWLPQCVNVPAADSAEVANLSASRLLT